MARRARGSRGFESSRKAEARRACSVPVLVRSRSGSKTRKPRPARLRRSDQGMQARHARARPLGRPRSPCPTAVPCAIAEPRVLERTMERSADCAGSVASGSSSARLRLIHRPWRRGRTSARIRPPCRFITRSERAAHFAPTAMGRFVMEFREMSSDAAARRAARIRTEMGRCRWCVVTRMRATLWRPGQVGKTMGIARRGKLMGLPPRLWSVHTRE